jgi:hypothetical protein
MALSDKQEEALQELREELRLRRNTDKDNVFMAWLSWVLVRDDFIELSFDKIRELPSHQRQCEMEWLIVELIYPIEALNKLTDDDIKNMNLHEKATYMTRIKFQDWLTQGREHKIIAHRLIKISEL